MEISKTKYEEAKLVVDAYNKQEKERLQKECKHSHTREGNMPNSQSVHFYIECVDCKKRLRTWTEPA